MRLENKVAFISGGARGMGAAEARLFASEGAKVVIGDVLEEEGRQTEAQINESGGECLFIRLDVTSEANWQDVVAATVARFGKLDILVNNAGIGGTSATVEETTSELWDTTMDINAKGLLRERVKSARDGSNLARVKALFSWTRSVNWIP